MDGIMCIIRPSDQAVKWWPHIQTAVLKGVVLNGARTTMVIDDTIHIPAGLSISVEKNIRMHPETLFRSQVLTTTCAEKLFLRKYM